MRCAFWLLVLMAVSPLATARAQSIQGPPGENSFCANYDDGSEPDCSYATFAQCQASVAGMQGYCNSNVRLPGRSMPYLIPRAFPQDPLGVYRDQSEGLSPVPPPPGE